MGGQIPKKKKKQLFGDQKQNQYTSNPRSPNSSCTSMVGLIVHEPVILSTNTSVNKAK